MKFHYSLKNLRLGFHPFDVTVFYLFLENQLIYYLGVFRYYLVFPVVFFDLVKSNIVLFFLISLSFYCFCEFIITSQG